MQPLQYCIGPTIRIGREILCLPYAGFLYIYYKGWEPTFLIRAFGLSEELSTEVGFAFSNNGLKSQDLQFAMIFFYDLFDNVC